jgi:DNA-binding GntR family transcriptional regulator
MSAPPATLTEDKFLKELGKQYQVTPTVARKALRTLEQEGWLENRGIQGLCLSAPRPVHGSLLEWDPAELHVVETGSGYLEERIPEPAEGTPEIRVLSKVLTTLPRELLKLFDVHGRSGHQASRVTKLHLVEAQPKVLEIILAPVHELPGLLMKDHRHMNLFRMIETDYHRCLTRVIQRIEVRPLLLEEARLLGSTEDFPALSLQRILHAKECPLALVEWIIPGGRVSLVQEGYALRGKPHRVE